MTKALQQTKESTHITDMSEEAKQAQREYVKQWRKRNRERVNAYQRDWNRRNPEKRKQYNAAYWERVIERSEVKQ